MIVSPICEMLGIKYPIFQGGMAWIADGKLAAAVSNGGGLGIISAMTAGGDYLREQIRIARSLTDKPFGVNIMLMSPHVQEVAKIVAEEKVAVVTTGAGIPNQYVPMWKEAGIKVIPVAASVAAAKMMARAGADAVIAEGGESPEGHKAARVFDAAAVLAALDANGAVPSVRLHHEIYLGDPRRTGRPDHHDDLIDEEGYNEDIHDVHDLDGREHRAELLKEIDHCIHEQNSANSKLLQLPYRTRYGPYF